jgi:SEC-C motif
MLTGTPKQISPTIRKFCQSITPNAKPIYLSVKATPANIALDCFMNVEKRIAKEGGTVQYGWRIWEWPRIMVEAEFHAVWRSPDGTLVDITPAHHNLPGVLFLPDPERIYEGQQVDSIRLALTNNPLIHEFININKRLFEIYNEGELANQHGEISLREDAKAEIIRLRRRQVEIQQMLASQSVGRNELCPCGSQRQYKRCCGRKNGLLT